jgi:hypothetical protein
MGGFLAATAQQINRRRLMLRSMARSKTSPVFPGIGPVEAKLE